MPIDNDTGPLKLRIWVWVVHAWYHLNGNPSTTEVLWVYATLKEADKHENFLKWKMRSQLGADGATEKKIKMVGISMRQSSKKLEKYLLDRFTKPEDENSREIPPGHMPYDPPTRMSRKQWAARAKPPAKPIATKPKHKHVPKNGRRINQ